jgi:hypothetical protein
MEKHVENYSPRTKDQLCRVYDHIVKFKGNPKFLVDFTENGVAYAYNQKIGLTGAKKWVEKFLSELESIKGLSEKQPLKVVKFLSTYRDGNGKVIEEKVHIEKYKSYNVGETDYLIGIRKQIGHWQHYEVIESKNI